MEITINYYIYIEGYCLIGHLHPHISITGWQVRILFEQINYFATDKGS